jgi:hypothetical protein
LKEGEEGIGNEMSQREWREVRTGGENYSEEKK